MGNIDIKKQLTIANLLTMLRLLAIPVMVHYLYEGLSGWKALVLFLTIWLTDCLDGYLARHYKQITQLGRILDPLVDKLLQLSTAFVMFDLEKLPLWVPLSIFAKEAILVIGGAILIKYKTYGSAQWFGKLATILFAIAFATLFFIDPDQRRLVNYIFILPVICTWYSLLKYGIYYFSKKSPASVRS